MIFILKENKIAKKVLSFKDQINIFPYLRYHTWKAHILLHVPPNVTLQCQRWIVQRRLSNFQKKISCKNNPLKVKIQRTRVSVKWHCSQTCFMYLLTCYLYYLKMQQRISNKISFVRTLFFNNKFRRII